MARTAAGSGAVLSLGAALVGPVTPAGAATFSVTNDSDAGPGSLRQAILDANAAAGDDEITFAPALGTITLTTGQIAVTDGLTITGPGQASLTVSGNDTSRIFYVTTADAVTISGLTLTSGSSGVESYGGAIRSIGGNLTIQSSAIVDSRAPIGGAGVSADNGSLTLTDSVISGNATTAPPGGGLRGGGVLARVDTLTVTDTLFSENNVGAFYGYGGGLEAGADTATITGSTFANNFASRSGGAARIEGGDVTIDDTTVTGNYGLFAGGLRLRSLSTTITDSTVSDNDGRFYAGGIGASGTVTITGSTISGNTSEFGAGGGILVRGGSASVAHSTISGNTASGYGGGGLWLQNGAATLDHTIVGDNTLTRTYSFGADIGGQGPQAHVTLANSLVEVAPALVGVTDGGGNVNGVDPGLVPLADNGGPTLTHALEPDSPAFDAGDPAFVGPPTTDQRGFPRVSGDAVDIGAVETQVTPSVVPGGASVPEGDAGTRVVNVRVRLSTRSGYPVTVDWATVDSVGQPAEGVDYESASGTVTFAPGETLKTVPITILGDTTDEPDEWVPVAFTNPTNATVAGYGVGFGVIRDDDPVPTVLPGGGAVTEGNTGTRVVNVKVKLSNPSSVPITVDWATLDSVDQPAEGVDYESASGTVTFAPGETLKVVPITILGDTTDEPDEWVPVAFTNPTNATIGGYGLGLGLIRDDD